MLRKKILKLIYFRKYSDSSSDLFVKHKILNEYQLHIYKLLKFVLKSLSKLHQERQLNDMFTFVERRITRSSAKPLLNNLFVEGILKKDQLRQGPLSSSMLFQMQTKILFAVV